MRQTDTFEYRATIIHDMDNLEIEFEGEAKANSDLAPVSIGAVLEGIANHARQEMGFKEVAHSLTAAACSILTTNLAALPEEVAEQALDIIINTMRRTVKMVREGRIEQAIDKAREELRNKRGEEDGPPQFDDVQREIAARAAAEALRNIFK